MSRSLAKTEGMEPPPEESHLGTGRITLGDMHERSFPAQHRQLGRA